MSAPSGTLRAFKITLEKQQAFVIGYPGEFDLDGRYQATLSMHDVLFVQGGESRTAENHFTTSCFQKGCIGRQMTTDFAVPVNERYFEDYVEGASLEYGQITLSADEIIEFARRYDPQPIHIDPDAAARGPFGGLIASGWHTAAVMMRLLADNFISHVAGMASPGVDEVRWLLPVRPGDALSIRVTVLEARRSRSKPDRGIVRTHVEVLNQRKEIVMTLRPVSIFRCRSGEITA